MKTNKIGLLAALVFFSVLLVSGVSAVTYCGTGYGTCSCGDYLKTTYTLSSSDPITNTTCPSTGLTLHALNITLDCADYSITGSGSGYGLVTSSGVTGATIQNCDVSGFGIGIYLYNSPSNRLENNTASSNGRGIHVRNSDSSVLNNNEVSGSTGYEGILMDSSDNVNLTDNVIKNNAKRGIVLSTSTGNDISGNTISYNQLGLYVPSYAPSSGNTIYNNNFISNTNQAHDDGGNNAWDDGCIGNYWSDWISNPGYPSTYIVPGTPGGVDNYPLDSPVDWVYLTTPLSISTNVILTNNYKFCCDGIKVIADGITLDCNGFTISSARAVAGYVNGVYLEGRNGVTIKDCTVDNFNYGIKLVSSSSNNNIIGNTLTRNNVALALRSSSDYNTLKSNTVINGSYGGIGLTSSHNNNLITNSLTNSGGSYGIRLSGSNSNTLNGNTVSSNPSGYAIDMRDGSSGNTVTNNTVSNNINIGVYTAANSSGNAIYYNNIIGNNWQASDSGTNNIWDDGSCAGNYWSDWISGTYTIPYGTAGSVDNYPLAQQWPNGYDNNNNGIADCAEAAPSIRVHATKLTTGSGNKPEANKQPLVLDVKLYDRSTGSCAAGYSASWQNYDDIVLNCNPIASGTTSSDLDGDPRNYEHDFNVPQGDYVVIGVGASTDYKHLGSPISATDELWGVALIEKNLMLMVKADGKSTPAKGTKVKGSELLIIEPEYVEWTSEQELYPFVFETLDSWTATTEVSPPEGYVADVDSLSEDVTNEIEAVQFTITEVGSAPGSTFVTHRVKGPNGRTVVIKSGIPAATPAQVKASKAKGKGVTGFAIAEGDATTHAVIIAITALTLIGVVILLLRRRR